MSIVGQRFFRLFAVIIIGFMTSTSNVWAIPVSTVGSVDNYIGFCNGIPASLANEITCIGTTGAVTVTAAQKFAPSPSQGELQLTLLAVDGLDDTYAFLLPEAWRGSHFLLKTGNVNAGGQGGPQILSYIFENLSSTAYAVFNLNSSLNDNISFPFEIGETGKISHLTAIQVSAVPLPAGIWMLLSVFGGMFVFKKLSLRFKKA